MRVNFRRKRFESIEQHRQPRTIDFRAAQGTAKSKAREGPALQTLVEKPQAVAIKEQDLQPIPPLVGEHEEMARERVVAEVIANDMAAHAPHRGASFCL